LRAQERLEELHRRGMDDATLYDPVDSSVGGTHAIFILRGEAATFNLPPNPDVPTVYLKRSWTSSALAASLLLGGAILAFLAEGKRAR
jgi:formate dehydrogenase iron-sulfur subunit